MSNSLKQKYKAAVYLRLSREDGDIAEGNKLVSNSIANQKELILEFIDKHDEIELKNIYTDDGYSGVNFERPDFQRMLADIRKGEIDCVIVKDLSRFGRNYIESGRYIEKIFPMLGIRFIAVTDNYDSSNDDFGNDMVVPFKNLINDAYCRDISIKVRSHLDMKRKNGEFIGAFAAYGYVKDDNNKNHLVVDEYAATVVQDIFAMKLCGMSNQSIADRLNADGILSPMEYKRSIGIRLDTPLKKSDKALWRHTAILHILKNEIYTGTLVQGKRTSPNYKIKARVNRNQEDWIRVSNAHEAIISSAEFQLVQELLLRDTRRSPKGESLYLFSGMVFCGDCDAAMVRKTVKNHGKSYIYHICSGNKKNKDLCSSHRISDSRLTETVLISVQNHIKNVLQMQRALECIESDPYIKANENKQRERLNRKKEELEKITHRKLSLYEDLKDGILTRDEYEQLHSQYEGQIIECEKAIEDMQEKLSLIMNNDFEKYNWIQTFCAYLGIKELSRNVIVTMIDRIVVFDSTRVVIHFKFEKEYLALCEYISSCSAGGKKVV